MQKSKFGFSLWLYPLLSLVAIALEWTMLIPVAILCVVIIAEQNEWAIRQCVHAVLIGIIWSVYNLATGIMWGFWNFVSGIVNPYNSTNVYNFIGNSFRAIGGLIYIAFIVLIVILGILPIISGNDIRFPGKTLVDRLYGVVRPKPQYQQYRQQNQYGYPPQYPPQQQPAQNTQPVYQAQPVQPVVQTTPTPQAAPAAQTAETPQPGTSTPGGDAPLSI